MIKKEMIAMLLAGGQGSRLGVLTSKLAKPAVAFGGKYKIIDFPLSNCINSGIDTVGVLTQYRPLRLNQHIGIGIPWDLDRNIGGVTVLPPYEKSNNSEWYTGTANAIYQNIEFIDYYNPDYVLILSGDHIYKMDYEHMLEYHKSMNADVTLATYQVPWEEASRFGVVITNDDGIISEFEEKPENPRSNKASMGIYIFNWKILREALVTMKDIVPEFNLYEEFWKIYTKTDAIPPQYIDESAKVTRCIIGEGTEIYGTVENSVIGSCVTIGEGAVVKDSIIMNGVTIEAGAYIEKGIIAENVKVGANAKLGVGEEAVNEMKPNIYAFGLVTIGENSVIPEGVTIGKNTAIFGDTDPSDYPDGQLPSGGSIIKAGE